MPLRKGQPYAPGPPSLNLSSDVRVFLIRFTGEIFTEFEDYTRKLSQYRKRVWSCQETGKAGLTYEEALLSEARSKGAIYEVPECYEEHLLRAVHHATGKLEDVAAEVVAEFQDRIVVGEEVSARIGDAQRPCMVLSITSIDHGDPGNSADGDAAAEPEQILEVAWLDGSPVSEGAARIHRDQVSRRRPPLTQPLVTGWMQENMHADSVQGVKGFPCIWHASQELQEQYGLPSDLPKDLVRQIKAAQKAAEEKPKPPPRKPAEPRKPRKAVQEVDPEAALSIKAEAAAIAAAAFADAAAVQKFVEPVADEALPDGGQPGRRQPGSGAKRKAAAAAKPPREPKPPKQPKAAEPRKPKKTPPAELDPEAALSIKAEAAAIAAAVFAEAAARKQPAEPDEPPPKKRRRSSGPKAAPKQPQATAGLPGPAKTSPRAAADGGGGAVVDVTLLSPEELENIPGLKCESVEETDQRIASGTVKRAIFEALRAAGREGLDTGALVEAVTAAGVKSWEDARIAKSSVASSCTHDPAFARLQKGRFALRALRPDLEEATMNAILQRAANRQGGLAAAAAARNAPGETSTPQNNDYHKNSFKCSKCHRTHHLQGSPMLLCDSCPRGFHMACLELDYNQLPIGDWACPKCELGEAKAAKREARAANKDRVPQSRGPLSEKEKEERKLKRALEKAERQLAKHQARENKELLKLAEKDARDIVKAASPRNASKLPPDDLQVLEEEKENLRKLEERAKNIASEAAHAAEMEVSLANAEGVPGVEGAVAAATALRERQKDAEEKLERLRKAIEGPPELEVVVRSPSAHASLMDALAISEFLAAFGVVCEAAVLGLADVQKSVARPLTSSVLSKAYMSLLRCVLLEKVGQDGLMRSRARRWARVVDEATWPEVLRRYLLATRATLPQPSADDLSADPALLDDDVIAVCAAELLAGRPYYRLEAPLHLRLLTTLCNDVVNGSALRAEFAARIDEAAQMQTQHRQLLAEEKKEQKQKQDAAEAEAKAAKEAAEAAAPDQAPPSGEQSADAAPPTDAPVGDAKQTGDARSGEAGATGGGASEEREREEARQQREAEFDEQLRARAVRADMLGQDRHFRRYWWLQGEQATLWVEDADGGALSLISEPAQLEALMEGLNRRGVRERALLNTLKRRQQQITEALSAQPPQFAADLAEINRVEGARREKLEAKATAAALRSAAAQAELLVEEVAAQKGTLADTPTQWRARLRGIASIDDLISALRDLETQLNVLGDGLPKGAKDEQLQPLLQNGQVATTPAAPEALPNGYHSAQEEAPESADHAHSNGGSAEPLGRAASEGESVEGAARSSEDVQLPSSSRGPSQEASQELEPGEEGPGLFAQPRPRRPKYVTPVDELDESDAEAAQRDSRRIGLWRSARERAVWLLDVQRADTSGSLAAAAYASVVLRDRMQPLLHRMAKRLARAARMAERAEAEADMGDDVAMTESESDDDRPLLPKAPAAAPPPAAPAAAERAPTKLKLKLKVGGVAVGGGEGKNGKKKKKKDEKKPSEAERPPSPEPAAAGGGNWDPNDDDRWGSECFKCGHDGDLLCCEGKGCRVVMHPSCAGLPAVPEGDWYCPEHAAAAAAKSKAAKDDKGAAAAAAAPKKKKVLKKLKDIEGGNAPADAKAKQKGSNKKRERSDSGADQSGGQKRAAKTGLKVTFKKSKAAAD